MASLREIRVTRPEEDASISKRWLENEFFDLFLWSRAGQPFHMQLCYGKPMHERAVSWREGHGYFHDGVLSLARGNAMAGSELLEAGGKFDFANVNARFLRESQGLETPLRKFVLEKLHHFALNGPTHPNRPPRIKVRRDGFEAAAPQDLQADLPADPAEGSPAGPPIAEGPPVAL